MSVHLTVYLIAVGKEEAEEGLHNDEADTSALSCHSLRGKASCHVPVPGHNRSPPRPQSSFVCVNTISVLVAGPSHFLGRGALPQWP